MWLFRIGKRGWNCECNIFFLSVISCGYGAFPISQTEPVLLKGIFRETLMEPRSYDVCVALQT